MGASLHRASFLLLLALAVFAAGCATTHRPVRLVASVKLDDRSQFTVPPRSGIAVLVPHPEHKGYQWTALEYDRNFLRPAGREPARNVKELRDVDPDQPVMLFDTLTREGTTELTLAYCQPATCEKTALTTVTLRLIVEKLRKK